MRYCSNPLCVHGTHRLICMADLPASNKGKLLSRNQTLQGFVRLLCRASFGSRMCIVVLHGCPAANTPPSACLRVWHAGPVISSRCCCTFDEFLPSCLHCCGHCSTWKGFGSCYVVWVISGAYLRMCDMQYTPPQVAAHAVCHVAWLCSSALASYMVQPLLTYVQ